MSTTESRRADAIIDACAAYYGITRQAILGHRRTGGIARARMVAVYLCVKHLQPRVSLSAIGHLFRRDHTTVIHARDHVAELLEEDQDLRSDVAQIEAQANVDISASTIPTLLDIQRQLSRIESMLGANRSELDLLGTAQKAKKRGGNEL